MSLKILKTEDVKADIIECAYFIAEVDLNASKRFTKAADDAIDRLAAMPGIGSLRDYGNPALTGMRVWPIPKFRNYLIFYRETTEGLEILRILHGAQDLDTIFASDTE